MNDNKEYIWYTGDWKRVNYRKPPYNGVLIKAIANYDPPTSPPATRKLISVDLEIVDYSYDPKGVSSTVVLDKVGIWYDIPLPENNETSPPMPNPDFTVKDINGKDPGKLKLDKNLTGIFLNIQFRYGIEHLTREELGYIMKIEETYNENKDSISVSG